MTRGEFDRNELVPAISQLTLYKVYLERSSRKAKSMSVNDLRGKLQLA